MKFSQTEEPEHCLHLWFLGIQAEFKTAETMGLQSSRATRQDTGRTLRCQDQGYAFDLCCSDPHLVFSCQVANSGESDATLGRKGENSRGSD